MKTNKICLLVGTSGVGKSTIVAKMEDKFKLRPLNSYTTRPRRNISESGHKFVTDSEFEELGTLCAYTQVNGYQYGATIDQVNNSDLYIIDEYGIRYFDENYTGNKDIYIVRLVLDDETCITRMKKRGDSNDDVQLRLKYDRLRADLFERIVSQLKKIDKNKVFTINIGSRTPEDIADYIYRVVFNNGKYINED